MRLTVVAALLIATSLAAPAPEGKPAAEALQAEKLNTNELNQLGADGDLYYVGRGKVDITGPVGSKMGGYDWPTLSYGIESRLWARAFAFRKSTSDPFHIVVVIDRFFVDNFITKEVRERLATRLPSSANFDAGHLVLHGTSTHSATSVWSQYGVMQLSSNDSPWTLSDLILLDGIVSAVEAAVAEAASQRAYLAYRVLDNANTVGEPISIQRAPQAYDQNPSNPFGLHKVDGRMTTLKIYTSDKILGMINWFAVDGTGHTRGNGMISGDVKGNAAVMLEREIGGDFVGAFANGAFGDTSPRIKGPRCSNGTPDPVTGERAQCDFVVKPNFETFTFDLNGAKTCGDGDYKKCYNRGPLYPNDDEAANSYEMARNHMTIVEDELLSTSGWKDLKGTISSAYQYWNLKNDGTCEPGIGFHYLAGNSDDSIFDTRAMGLTEDGSTTTPSTPQEQLVHNTVNMISSMYLDEKSQASMDCHAPKDLLGDEKIDGDDAKFFPTVVGVGVTLWGTESDRLVTVQVPTSTTAQAGKEITDAVAAVVTNGEVIPMGPVNLWGGYATTKPEYNRQRFEGAATLFGPKTTEKIAAKAAAVATCLKNDNCPAVGASGNTPAPATVDPTTQIDNLARHVMTGLGGGYTGEPPLDHNDPNSAKWGEYKQDSLWFNCPDGDGKPCTHTVGMVFHATGQFGGHIYKQRIASLRCAPGGSAPLHDSGWEALDEVLNENDPELNVHWRVNADNSTDAFIKFQNFKHVINTDEHRFCRVKFTTYTHDVSGSTVTMQAKSSWSPTFSTVKETPWGLVVPEGACLNAANGWGVSGTDYTTQSEYISLEDCKWRCTHQSRCQGIEWRANDSKGRNGKCELWWKWADKGKNEPGWPIYCMKRPNLWNRIGTGSCSVYKSGKKTYGVKDSDYFYVEAETEHEDCMQACLDDPQCVAIEHRSSSSTGPYQKRCELWHTLPTTTISDTVSVCQRRPTE